MKRGLNPKAADVASAAVLRAAVVVAAPAAVAAAAVPASDANLAGKIVVDRLRTAGRKDVRSSYPKPIANNISKTPEGNGPHGKAAGQGGQAYGTEVESGITRGRSRRCRTR